MGMDARAGLFDRTLKQQEDGLQRRRSSGEGVELDGVLAELAVRVGMQPVLVMTVCGKQALAAEQRNRQEKGQ